MDRRALLTGSAALGATALVTTGIKAEEPRQAPQWEMFTHVSDSMEPTIRRGGEIIIEPATAYDGHGVYLVEELGRKRAYRANMVNGHINLTSDNPLYSTDFWISPADFASIVTDRVAWVLTNVT